MTTKEITLSSGLKVKVRRPGLKLTADAQVYAREQAKGDDDLAAWYAGLWLVVHATVEPQMSLEPEDGKLWVDDLSMDDFRVLSEAIQEMVTPAQVEADIDPLSETGGSS